MSPYLFSLSTFLYQFKEVGGECKVAYDITHNQNLAVYPAEVCFVSINSV
jgi:hypothetical protein